MHRFFSFLAIILVLTNLVKVLAFQIDSLRLVHLSSSNAAFFQANKKSVTNQNPIRKSVLTQSCHRPDITTTFLRYTNKEFSDGAEETNTKTDIPAPPPKKKSRVTRVVRSTSAGATNQVRTVVTLEELQECRNECDAKGSLMIVRFFSHWCKSCKAVEPMYKRLARQNPEVTFVDIPITRDNEQVRDALNVVAVPFGHIYHPTAGLMEELNMGRRFWSEFQDIFHRYTKGSCEVGGEAFEYLDPIQAGKVKKVNF